MNLKTNVLFFFGCLSCSIALAQLDTYDYKMEVSDITDQWHKIALTDPVFSKIEPHMNDIRIYGITTKDTIEAPYLLRIASEKSIPKEIGFKLLNFSSNTNGHYFTYKILTSEAINEIQLDFNNENFDWKIRLEGSHDQQEWFTILKDYRILSIKNDQTNFSFTKLKFTDSKYRYYRLLVKSAKNPELNEAKIVRRVNSGAEYKTHTTTYIDITTKDKETLIDVDLKQRLPLSFIKINVQNTFDYYRPYTIAFVSDSVQTEKGVKYQYTDLGSGTLNSFEKNGIRFNSTLAKKIRITIQNFDNQPLQIDAVEAKGYVHELVARFTKPADYYLAYGKTNTKKPQYDISHSASKIPKNLTHLTLGDEQAIAKKEAATVAPLFENKIWLWVIMGIVILTLGGFTLKMMAKK